MEEEMKKGKYGIYLALLIFILAGPIELSYSTTSIIHPFNYSIEPITPLIKNTPITFNLTFGPAPKYYNCGDTGSVSITLYKLRNINDTIIHKTWPVQFNNKHLYSTSFQVIIPDNDTTVLRVSLSCGWIQDPITRYFITTEDTIQFLKGYQCEQNRSSNSSKTNDPIRDTLTEEQLSM